MTRLYMNLIMYNLIILFVCILINQINSNPHVHQRGGERVEDSWNSIHYKDGEHHSEYDHEAVLGSRDTAKEFDGLTPEESKIRLRKLVTAGGMDSNRDGFVDKEELIEWVLKSFRSLAQEDGNEQLEEEDQDKDGVVSWDEHLKDSFDIDDSSDAENSLQNELMSEDRALWKAADLNGDDKLDANEYAAFNSPEEYNHMHDVLYEQTMIKKDKDRDGFLSFAEYAGDVHGIPPDPKTDHYVIEKDRFEKEFDVNNDGKLDKSEVLQWIIPDNRHMAESEAVHLISSSDSDGDDKLSIEEIIDHHDVFVGSEATDFGQQLENIRSFDEL